MFQGAGIMQSLFNMGFMGFWIAQLPGAEGGDLTPVQEPVLFLGPRFYIALIAGVVLAFAFQLLLTNLSVAAGISYLGQSSQTSSDEGADSLGTTIRKIGFGVGLWTLVTVTISLFLACFLAIKLSLLEGWDLAAILGLVIWATYFSLLVWVSSTTVGSLIGSVVNTATSGFQAIVGTAAAALGGRAIENRVVSTAEAATAAVTRELRSAIDPISVRHSVEDYLETLPLPELNLSGIRQEFERILSDPALQEAAATGGLGNVTRQTFIDLVSARSDLSKRDLNRIADQLYGAWQRVVGSRGQEAEINARLLDYLKSAHPEDLRSNQLNQKLDQLIDEARTQKLTSEGPATSGIVDQARQYAVSTLTSTLMGAVLGRTDLSDLDVESILNRLRGMASQLSEQSAALPFNTIRNDVENYLLNSYPWHLNRETINFEFRNVLYDPEANPGVVRRQLQQLSRAYFVELLNQRGDLTPARISDIADQMEAVRQDMLSQVEAAAETQKGQSVRQRVENYLASTGKPELSPEGIERDFRILLEDPETGAEALRARLSQFDRDTLVQLLSQRQDISQEEVEQRVSQLEAVRDRVIAEAEQAQEQARSAANALQTKVESYLRNTHKDELDPEGIKRDLRALLDDPQVGTAALRARLSQFDRETFVQLLSQRQDISQEEADRLVNQMEAAWYNTLHAPQVLAGKTKEQYDQTLSEIADYLRNTNREELNPEGIRQDLALLLDHPKLGATALRQRLSEVDRDTLVQLLSQRQDLSEEQVNQVIDQVLETIRRSIGAPRRWALRAQTQVRDFESGLESYLRNTEKAELNPEGIKRDLQLLINDPRVGMESLGERLSEFDRSTFVALLAQRHDITEEEANRIADQIVSVRNQVVEQIRTVQRRIQAVIDSIFARIRTYLNSLERPELNYEGIKHDLRKLFDDPQVGFDSLRDRLSQFDRGTLVAVMSSREDISEADANRIIDQVESARNTVLQRAERLQQETQRRLEAVRQKAQEQAEETRKAAATAAWWLFWTAVISSAASAGAGVVAVLD